MPELGPRTTIRSADSLASSQSIASADGAWPADRWWQGLHDSQLEALVAEALAASPDLAAASARVRAADALALRAGASKVPRLDWEASAGGVQQSRNLGIPPQFVPEGVQDTGLIAASLSFDLDLWGRNRAALLAATSEAEAARADEAQARLLLTTALAISYAELGSQFRMLDLASELVRLREANASIIGLRVAAGLDNGLAAREAESRLAGARADVAAAEEAIAVTRHRIAALVGAGPDRGLAIERPSLRVPASALPAQARINLLGRRPDIVAARLRAEAADRRVDVARARYYPNINLNALVGLQSLGLDRLFSAGSEFGRGGAAISLPLFDGGERDAAYRGAHAERDAAIADYDRVLIEALREVADLVARRNANSGQLAERAAALRAARKAVELAEYRYRAGLTTRLALLAAEERALLLEQLEAELEARQQALDIALIRALGGGYQDQAGT